MTPSPFQQAIYDFYKTHRDKNLMVEAVAGSGKTTTIKDAIGLDFSRSILYLVFNKRNADEAATKLGAHRVSTFNSFGHGLCMRLGGKFDKWKTWKLNDDLKVADKARLSKLVSLLKAHVCLDKDDTLLAQIVDKYDLDDPPPDLWPRYLKVIHDTRLFDFDDQIFIPVQRGRGSKPIVNYETVFVDECQDLNPVKIQFLQLFTGNKILVGDSHQAIYGFAGADTEAMKSLKTVFDCVELPLSINYRCGKSIITEAQQYVPHITAWDQSPAGIVDRGPCSPEAIGFGEYILCRNTAPLVKLCLKLIAAEKPATILGREGLESITRFMDRVPFSSRTAWYETEYMRLIEANRTSKAAALEDTFDTIDALAEGCGSWAEVKARIDKIFTDRESRGITLMTIHKSKGLEAHTVRLLAEWKSKASSEWQVEQENNLKYVAITRAKERLIYES